MDDFTKARVGDKLYSLIYGEVTVEDIELNSIYPLLVKSKKGDVGSFTSDGRYRQYGDQTLFWAKPHVVAPPTPPRKVKRWITGCYGYDGKIFIEGFGMHPTLFESAEAAGIVTFGSKIAFVVEVEVDEDALT